MTLTASSLNQTCKKRVTDTLGKRGSRRGALKCRFYSGDFVGAAQMSHVLQTNFSCSP